MPRKTKKTETTQEPSLLRRELSAIFFLAIGVFIYLSLLSYHPLDPSFFSVTSKMPIHNWCGIVGSYLSDALIFLFGGGSYFLGGIFFIIALSYFMGVRQKMSRYDLPVYVVFTIFVSILFQLAAEKLIYSAVEVEAGGLLGSVLGHVGLAYLGRTGSYLLVIAGSVFTFIWATRLSLRDISSKTSQGLGAFLTWLGSQVTVHWARFKKRLDTPREIKLAPKAEPVLSAPVIARDINDDDEEEVSEMRRVPIEPGLREKLQRLSQSGPVISAKKEKKKAPAAPQLEFQNLGEGYKLPPLNLLDAETDKTIHVDEESLKMNARLLEKKLEDFEIHGKVTEIHPGPVITMYEFQPAPGIKLSRISGMVDDLSLAMEGRSVRIVAPLPNKAAVGIEIPNNERETVWLKDVIADDRFQKNESKLIFALGKDAEGIPYCSDLAKMPHLLVAGATGAGKSVSINSMIISILYKARPEEVRLIMVDPKMLELSIYEDIPHLLLPVVTSPKKAALALQWAVREMERRYKLLADINARNITNYNAKIESKQFTSRSAEKKGQVTGGDEIEALDHSEKLPYIVIIIDELADLMMVSSNEVEATIMRLAQMARAAGIHLILATQRPSVDVITGVIKANFPARISFKVSSKHDSRTILDTVGSERLLGNGDMLFVPPGTSKMMRVHGAFISESEVGRVVEFLKKQAKPVYNESILQPVEGSEGGEGGAGGQEEEADELYDQAVAIVAESKQASISFVQRRLRVGYNRAARMIERMEMEGIVTPATATGHRQVLVSSFSNQ
ncbi:DNA translocase FtsK 4TM domain-containing protein [bacterium]|nr:DNA translocase FtsK 4TM domain-containing protein [bacterium]